MLREYPRSQDQPRLSRYYVPHREAEESGHFRQQLVSIKKRCTEGCTHHVWIRPHEGKAGGVWRPVDVVHATGHSHDRIGYEQLLLALPIQDRASREMTTDLDHSERAVEKSKSLFLEELMRVTGSH